MVEDKEVLKEWGCQGDEMTYEVVSAFFIKVCDGPLMVVSPGDLVKLQRETAFELLSDGKILPMGIPEIGDYEAQRAFTVVNDEGLWALVEKRDVLRLFRAEAITLLKEFKIKPKEVSEEKGGKNEAKS